MRPSLPLLSAQWWQGFLHGNADAVLGGKDARRPLELVAAKLGREFRRLDINGSIRSCELRKKVYAEFGADLALYTMQALWLEASSNGEQLSTPTVPKMPEAVAKFYEPGEPNPPWRMESVEDSAERRSRESFGGWCG